MAPGTVDPDGSCTVPTTREVVPWASNREEERSRGEEKAERRGGARGEGQEEREGKGAEAG